MNTQETNTVLDLPENNPANTKPEWRPYFLAIESAMLVLILLTGYLTPSAPVLSGIFLLSTLGLILFNFVVPIIKLIRQEVNLGLFFLYIFQALAIALILMGIVCKIESFPYASEFLIVGILSMCLFFTLIPNVEIRKYKAKGAIHLLVTLMGLVMIVGYTGILFRIEAFLYANQLLAVALVLVIPILGWLITEIRRSKEHFYLKYYLPRIALMIYFAVNYLT